MRGDCVLMAINSLKSFFIGLILKGTIISWDIAEDRLYRLVSSESEEKDEIWNTYHIVNPIKCPENL